MGHQTAALHHAVAMGKETAKLLGAAIIKCI